MALENIKPSPGQEAFDDKYITSTEITERLSVDRSSILYARRTGLLPNPIVIKGVRTFIWERDALKPYLDAWTITLKARRGELK